MVKFKYTRKYLRRYKILGSILYKNELLNKCFNKVSFDKINIFVMKFKIQRYEICRKDIVKFISC